MPKLLVLTLALGLACANPFADKEEVSEIPPPATVAPPPGPPPVGKIGKATKAPPQAKEGEISVAALEALSPRPHVVDVRTAEEFAEGHVPGAVNIPLGELSGRLSELAGREAEQLAVICASGNRSEKATRILVGQGYTKATSVAGGTRAWVAAGYPMER